MTVNVARKRICLVNDFGRVFVTFGFRDTASQLISRSVRVAIVNGRFHRN